MAKRGIPTGTKLSIGSLERAAIWRQYEEDRPKPGTQLDAWIDAFSAETRLHPKTIRRVVTEGSLAIIDALHESQKTFAQQAADLLGADLFAALDTLRDGLVANRKRVLLDNAGRPKTDDDGNVIFIETEDWSTRLSAARSLVEVHGARAPQQFEVKAQTVSLNVNATVTDAQIELNRISDSISQLQAALAAGAEGTPGTSRTRKAIASAVSDSEQAILADAVYEDEGRAGPDKPV